MTDKQIIINGCDVSGCDFYDKNKKYCLTLKMNTTGFKNPSCFSGDFQECIQDSKVCSNTFCDNNHNCYYKQLQQLKAENEELTKIKNDFFRQAEISHEAVMNKNDIIEQLEKKLEKIKEIENNRNLTINKRREEINKLATLSSKQRKVKNGRNKI